MTVFNKCHIDGLRALASVPVDDLTVVLAADEDVSVLWVILEADERRRRLQSHLRLVGVLCHRVTPTIKLQLKVVLRLDHRVHIKPALQRLHCDGMNSVQDRHHDARYS